MAKRTQVLLTDDIDGGDATQTVRFALGSQQYEIDLSDRNAAKLEKALAPYTTVARRVRSIPGQRRSGAAPSGLDVKAVRAWAKEHGYEVSSRGRLPAEVIAAYNEAG